MWSLNCQPHQTRPMLQQWRVREPEQILKLPRTRILLRSQTLLPHLWLTQRVCRSVCAPHQTGGSDYAGRHRLGCGTGGTCSTGRCGSAWGNILRVLSSSYPMIKHVDVATDLDRPRAQARSCLGAIDDSTCKGPLLVRVMSNKTSKPIQHKTFKIVC